MSEKLKFTELVEERVGTVADGLFKGDIADRIRLAQRMEMFIRAQSAPITIGLNGEWGSGKTFFLRGFEKYIGEVQEKTEKPRGICVYLNAWEDDYLDNPLLFVFAGIIKAIELDPTLNIVDPNGLEVLKKSVFAICKGVFNGLTNGVAGDMLEDVIKATGSHPLAIYDEQTKTARQLKTYLSKVGAAVRKTFNMPLVVIVDELDRCRPTYAIEMLERIKHLFSVPNVVFVLGADFVELGKSIQAVYGEINTDKYLERLIQYRFELPRLSPGVYLNSIVERCNIEGLVETHCEQGSDGSDEFRRASVALATLRYLANSHSFSLREVEHLLRLFQVGVLNSEFSTLGLVLLAMVCVLKLSNPEVLDAWINGSKDHNVVVDAVLNTRGCHFAQPDPIRELFAYLVRVGQLTNNLELESISEEFYQAYGLAEKRRPTRALGDKYVEAILQGMRRTTEGRHIDFGGPWVAKYVKRLQFVFE